MPMKTEASLDHFFIFNSTYSKKEGEEKNKILYYYPSNTDIDTQIKHVGLSEAIIKFTESFNPGKSCDSCQTQKTRQIYYQPEPNFWMVMIIGLPYITKQNSGVDYVEYQNDDISSEVCLAILKQAYTIFRFFMGSFNTILNEPDVGSITLLKCKLEHFYSRYLLTIKLNNMDILDMFQGLQFLPLDKVTFLRVQCFMNQVEAAFPQVKYTAFFYNEQLVWSGLEPEDMQVIYNYLTNTLIPAHLEKELEGSPMVSSSSSPFTSSHYGKFVTGPSSIHEVKNMPKVFLNYSTKPTPLYLVVYRALSATVCLFLDNNTGPNFYNYLDTFLGMQLTSLANSLSEQCSKQVSGVPESGAKFIYFNKLNLAYKSTLHSDVKQLPNSLTTPEVLSIITEMNKETSRSKEAVEIVIKTKSDYWIVGKISNLREFFAVIQQKNASIIEIDDEVKKLCEQQLKSIFFH